MDQVRNLLKESAIRLRRKGESYSQIQRSLKIPKSTLSNWFSSVKWSKEIKDKLNANNRLRNNLKAANMERRRRFKARYLSYIKSARKTYIVLKDDPLFLTGISLYWGEGEKTNSGRVSLVNTDPEMMLIIAKFYRKCLCVPDSALRVGLFIYDDIDERMAKKFWSIHLEIPEGQFIKTQILKSRTKHTKRRSKYGICSLYFSNTELSIKIREWISLVGQEFTYNSTLSGISLPVKQYLAKV